MEKFDLRGLQEAELEILLEIDRICKKHNIRYFLNSGTLLGAVRHKGFIPWDDDIDICLPLKEYRRFKKAAKKELGSDYFLQSYDTDLTNIWFTKIRKNGTTAIEKGSEGNRFHQGIWVDVFPLIGIKKDPKWLRRVSKTMGFPKWLIKKKVDLIVADDKIKGLKKLHKLVPLSLFRAFAKFVYFCTLRGFDNYEHSYCVWTEKKFFAKYPSELFKEETTVVFEGKEFPAPKNWDKYLTIEYGDYMTPPPPEKRKGGFHTVSIVDLDNDYKKYINAN